MSKPGDKNHPETDDLVEVARVYGPFEAELIKNFLGSHGIEAIVRGRTAPFVYPFTVDGLAEFKIFVAAADRAKAEDLIAAMPAPDGADGPEKSD